MDTGYPNHKIFGIMIEHSLMDTRERPFNHDRTHRSTGTCGPSQSGRLQVGRPPLLLHSHGTGPRLGTGQGHRAGGLFKLYSPRLRSLAGSDSITEALARTSRPSQKDFKLGGPRCSGCCTVPDRHRTGPSGRRAGGPLYSPRSLSRAAT